jgi:hypothetical protein
MKTVLLIAILLSAVSIIGCQKESVMPDTSEVKRPLPPGGKTKDVLLPINK